MLTLRDGLPAHTELIRLEAMLEIADMGAEPLDGELAQAFHPIEIHQSE